MQGLGWRLGVVMALVIAIAGCGGAPQSSPPTAGSSAPETGAPAAVAPDELDPAYRGLPQLVGPATVRLEVKSEGAPEEEAGRIVEMQLDGEKAPITAGNFVDLVQRGVYDGTSFHRVVREPSPFVVQGGDPQSKDPRVPLSQLGIGSFIEPQTQQPRLIPLEILPAGETTPLYGATFEMAGLGVEPALKHLRGAVAMARSPAPDSASAQFYFALSDLPMLDGSYAVFGYVTEGLDVVDGIQQGDRVVRATVVSGLENLRGAGATADDAPDGTPDGAADEAPTGTPASPETPQ
jgi:peptidyl-prolyl cis-trans isomerase B (cyclophilin B)